MKHLLAGKSESPSSKQCPHCFHCKPSLLNEFDCFYFEKIKSEEDLNKFENSLHEEMYKQNFIKFCFGIIGTERPKDDLSNCCLELSRAIFDKTFWSPTTWLGTIQSGGTKFPLS